MEKTPPSLLDLAQQLEKVAREHACYSQVHEIIFVMTGYIRALHRIETVNQEQAAVELEKLGGLFALQMRRVE